MTTLAPQRPQRAGDDIDTCAYVSGDPSSPMICPSSSTCTYGQYTDLICCSGAVCANQNSGRTPHGAPRDIYASDVTSCPQSAPFCVEVVIGMSSAHNVPFVIGCGASATTITALNEPDVNLTGDIYQAVPVTDPGSLYARGSFWES